MAPSTRWLISRNVAERFSHAYDLGYYGASATKDLMILQEAMKYSPDLIVWSVTDRTLSNEPKDFAMANSADLAELINTYGLSIPADQSLDGQQIIFFRRRQDPSSNPSGS